MQPEVDLPAEELDEVYIGHLVRNSYTDPRVSREDAYKALLMTNTFAGGAVGGGAITSGQAWAFRRILEDPEACGAFADLLRRGQLAGRLYALCGLYLLDSQEFAIQVQPYRSNREEVNTFFGCLYGPRRVSDLIEKHIASGDMPRALRGRSE